MTGNGVREPSWCPVTSPFILELEDITTMIYCRPKLHIIMILRPPIDLENRLKVIFGYFLKNNAIMTVFRSRDLKNGLRRFILFLDVGIVYTLIIMEDFCKIIFFLLPFLDQKDQKGAFLKLECPFLVTFWPNVIDRHKICYVEIPKNLF